MKLQTFTSRSLRAARHLAASRCDSRLAALAAALLAMAVPAKSELVSYLSLDTSDGVTLNGDAAITTGGLGKFGEALTLDGTGDWADVGANNPVTGGAVRTISTWVFQVAPPTVANKLATVIGIGTNNTDPGGQKWDFEIDNQFGGIEVGVGGGRNAGSGLTGLTGNWMLLVSTLPVAGGTIGDVKTYLNGVVTNTGTGTKLINTAGTRFDLGVSANGSLASQPQFLNGRIDDVAIWNDALTADEIKGLYDVGDSVELAYTASDFDQLKQLHDGASGSAVVGGFEWTYATGLAGPAGLSGGSGSFTLVLDATAGTGLTGVPFVEQPFAITSITAVGGGVWELTLTGEPDTRYEFRSSSDLDFTPGTLIQGLVKGNPGTDAGTIAGLNNEFVTTDGNGAAVVRVSLSGTRNFVRAQNGGPLVSFDFEADGQGFTPSGDWAWGVAASNNGLANGQVTGGNGSGTGHCWATVLGDGGPAINGSITPGVDSVLSSPDIDLTGVAGARLQFAAAVDAAAGDTLEVRVRDAGDDTLLDTITPIPIFPTDNALWQPFDFALPASTDGNTIYLEFRFQGSNAAYLGFYLDDVTITY
jgi:hypothetical protein